MNEKNAMGVGSPQMDELRRKAEQRVRNKNATPVEAVSEVDACALVHELNRETRLFNLKGLPILCGEHLACSPTLGSGDTRQATIWSPRMRKSPAFCLAILQSALAATMESTLKDSETELADILAKEQMTRLKQIATQLQRPQAALDSEVSEKLQLTKEQSRKIQSLTRKDEKKLNAVLTEEQRTKWQEIVGRPFHGKITLPTQRMPLPRS